MVKTLRLYQGYKQYISALLNKNSLRNFTSLRLIIFQCPLLNLLSSLITLKTSFQSVTAGETPQRSKGTDVFFYIYIMVQFGFWHHSGCIGRNAYVYTHQDIFQLGVHILLCCQYWLDR